MFPLFETVCILDGKIQNSEWHQWRFERSYRALFHQTPFATLFEGIEVPPDANAGTWRMRINYNETSRELHCNPYTRKEIRTLRLVQGNLIDYSLKFTDRSSLEELFSKRQGCDDILLVKNGFITDSSYCNIVLFDGRSWCTPDTPLLRGTARERLLATSRITEKEIKAGDLHYYKGFRLINAMRDFDALPIEPIDHIYQD